MIENLKATSVTYTGIYFSSDTREGLAQAKQAALLPFSFTLPCGNTYSVDSVEQLPQDNLPCPCGDPKHWFVRYEVEKPMMKGAA